MRKADLAKPDPPIYSSLPVNRPEPNGAIPEKQWSDRLTTWLLGYTVTNDIGPRHGPAKLRKALVKAFRKG